MKTKNLPINPVADEPESWAYRIGTACLTFFASCIMACAWFALAVWEFGAATVNTLLLGKGVREQLRDMEDDGNDECGGFSASAISRVWRRMKQEGRA